MTMLRIMKTLAIISMLIASSFAVVKRDEYAGLNNQPAVPTGNHANNPVYQSSAVNGNAGYSASGNYHPNNDQYGQDNSGQNYQSNIAANQQQAASVGQPNTGSLYYYYYPVQESAGKLAKELNQYQAAPSNQYTSSVSPNVGEQANLENQQQSGVGQPSVGQQNNQDLSYGAQDLSYSAQPLSDYQTNQPHNNIEHQQALNSLANTLQQYGLTGGQQYHHQHSALHANAQQVAAAASQPQVVSQPPNQVYHQANNQPQFPGQYDQTGGSAFPSSAEQAQLAAQFSQYQANQPLYGQYGAYGSASTNQPTYEASSLPSSYRSRYGLGSIIMPMLALAGLSLLIPTVSSLSTASGRKKRSINGQSSLENKNTSNSAAGSLASYIDRIERYYSLYKSAVEKEECMNRIICELGDVVSNVRGKATFFNIIDKVVPSWMGNKVGVFKNGALSPETGKCKKYTCY